MTCRVEPGLSQTWCFLSESLSGHIWFNIHTISETKDGCWENVYQQFDIQYLRGIVKYRGRRFSGYKDRAFRAMMIKYHGRPVRVKLELEV